MEDGGLWCLQAASVRTVPNRSNLAQQGLSSSSAPRRLGKIPRPWDPGSGYRCREDSADATRALLDDDHRVQRIGKRLSDLNATDCGLFVFTRLIFEYLKRSFRTGDHSLTGALRSLNGERLLVVPLTRGFWHDVDTL